MNNNYLGVWWFTDAIVFLYIAMILIGKYFSRLGQKTTGKQTRGGVLQLSSILLSTIYELCHLSTCKSVVNYLDIVILDY